MQGECPALATAEGEECGGGEGEGESAEGPRPLCTLPAALRRERLHRYDASMYPLAELLAEVILPESMAGAGAAELHNVHLAPEVRNWMEGAKKESARAYTMRRNFIDRRYKTARAFSPDTPTGQCYLRFLREVVLPAVREGLGGEGGGEGILYQREPNFRCHLPDTGHLLVHKHCDADYHHQQNEVNFWVPLTATFGSNTVWAESSPGAGDFRPFELEVGEAMQFWGNQCVHYTVPNDTDHTRITVDFRVIPIGHYQERYPMSHRRDGLPRFGKGAYFGVMYEGGGEGPEWGGADVDGGGLKKEEEGSGLEREGLRWEGLDVGWEGEGEAEGKDG